MKPIWPFAIALAATTGAQTNERFYFRGLHPASYQSVPSPRTTAATSLESKSRWLKLQSKRGGNPVECGDRVVLQLEGPAPPDLSGNHPLELSRVLPGRFFILQAPDALTAAREATRLSRLPQTRISYPVLKRPIKLLSPYAPRPNDPYFYKAGESRGQWQSYLENRDAEGNQLGPDLDVRAAWPFTRGEGIIVALGDDGVDLGHPDLTGRIERSLNFNFNTGTADGRPAGDLANHATAVAGLIAATANNHIGVSGAAPAARLASWVLFGQFDDLSLSDEQMMDAFQFKSNLVSVQNHSWGKTGDQQLSLSPLEEMALSNIVTFGRGGRGVVLVRAAGNDRGNMQNANDDGYTADSRTISVAAVRLDGRVTRYSTPGACVLVAAPSGDQIATDNPCLTNTANLVTTDRTGSAGYNQTVTSDDSANYVFGDLGFSGTSGSAPQISGVVALILSANTNLTYRDVQQILIQSSRHFDLADPDLTTNAAGFRVSHNLGFGVPDAGLAVRLARTWPNRPPATNIVYASTNAMPIPDLSFRLIVEGPAVPADLQSLAILPSSGIQPPSGFGPFTLADIGLAKPPMATDLTGKAALIQRGDTFFCEKVANAAAAGARLAVVYNNKDATSRIIMGALDLAPIPAVFLDQNDGEALSAFLQSHPETRVQIKLTPATYSFDVKETLLCEWIGVRVQTDHTRRGDLRIVLRSPQGTESLLQNLSADDTPGPVDWTYYTVHDFYECSAGRWTVEISDEDDKGTGQVTGVSLILNGVPILDSDHDGLDDGWEMRYFGTLAFGPKDDPDQDGYTNAREQILGTNPVLAEIPFQVDLSRWDDNRARLSWPSSTNFLYEVRIGSTPAGPWQLAGRVPGQFPETEWFTPLTNLANQFFRVQSMPRSAH